MSELANKLRRIRRIHALQSSQLKGLIAMLARHDAKIANCLQNWKELDEQKKQSLAQTRPSSLDFLTQTSLWIASIDRSIESVRAELQICEQARREAQTQVMDQHTRVRGMELLIDQLRLEFDADAATQQMLIADENALKTYAGS